MPSGSEALVASCSRSCDMCVNSVRLARTLWATSTASSRLKCVGCGLWRSASRTSTSKPSKQRPALRRNAVGVGAIGDVAEAKAQHAKLAVLEPNRHRPARPAPRTAPSSMRVKLDLRHAAAVVSGLVGKGIVERLANPGLDLLFAIDRHRVSQVVGKQPQVIQAEHVVGMVVGKQRRMDDADLLAQQLRAQVGRRVDQQVSAGQAQHQRAAKPVVARVGAGAGVAAAADDRHAHRGAGAQEDQLAADVGGDSRFAHGSPIVQGVYVGRVKSGGSNALGAGGDPMSDPKHGCNRMPIVGAAWAARAPEQPLLTLRKNRYKLCCLRILRLLDLSLACWRNLHAAGAVDQAHSFQRSLGTGPSTYGTVGTNLGDHQRLLLGHGFAGSSARSRRCLARPMPDISRSYSPGSRRSTPWSQNSRR